MTDVSTREIKRIVAGTNQTDGAGVKLVRVIGYSDVVDFDPFLMLDAFDSTNPNDYIKGFPWHPHRGIETVTYLIEGNIEHGDSLGNKGSILDGCCQWMTAGGGIIHQEMPQPSGHMRGLQLWLNLPRQDKMTQPQYRDIKSGMIPKIQEEGITVGVIAGSYLGALGATQGDYVKALVLDVKMDGDRHWELQTSPDDTLFIYVVDGAGRFGSKQTPVESHKAALFEPGDEFTAEAGSNGLRFVLFSGHPLKEPIAWGGPIVMNTQQELRQAFEELDEGTFIKHG
jgi:quercetin 2,3-dioxygenase